MNKIIEENLKPRTLIVYSLFFTALLLCVRGLPIPEFLKDLILMMQGYWAGSKIAQKGAGQ
jgi:hypothetical protein